MNFILNVLKSPVDQRDFIFTASASDLTSNSLPDTLDYTNELLPVRDQGSQGTCYAQSACCMKEWQESRDYGLNAYLSPQFFYNNRFNKYDSDQNNDYGMYGRDVMKILYNIGVCLEENYPYGRIEHRDQIDQQLYDEASQHRIKHYARIESIDDLKSSLFHNGPCLITVPVYNYGKHMWIPEGKEDHQGGHAMTIVGYNNDGFIIRNSWGNTWCDNGYCLFPYGHWGAQWEVWTTVDDITILNIPQDPEKNQEYPDDYGERDIDIDNLDIDNLDIDNLDIDNLDIDVDPEPIEPEPIEPEPIDPEPIDPEPIEPEPIEPEPIEPEPIEPEPIEPEPIEPEPIEPEPEQESPLKDKCKKSKKHSTCPCTLM
jgi:hypothetical protein